MSVPVQTPSKEYIANGTTTAFPLEFNCDKAEYLIVTLNGEEAPVGSWTLADDTVTFNVAPLSGVVVNLERNTPFQRTTNYQLYDNSFRPSAVNKDFDLIWWKLQELGYRDQVIWLALLKEIAERKLGDEDLLTFLNKQVEALKLDYIERDNHLKTDYISRDAELKNYIDQMIKLITGDPTFKGITTDFVTQDGRTQREINQQYLHLTDFKHLAVLLADGYDWSNAIIAAEAEAYSRNVGLNIPSGIYGYSKNITFRVHVFGQGQHNTQLKKLAPATITLLNGSLRDITIGVKTPEELIPGDTTDGLVADGLDRKYIENVLVNYHGGKGFVFKRGNLSRFYLRSRGNLKQGIFFAKEPLTGDNKCVEFWFESTGNWENGFEIEDSTNQRDVSGQHRGFLIAQNNGRANIVDKNFDAVFTGIGNDITAYTEYGYGTWHRPGLKASRIFYQNISHPLFRNEANRTNIVSFADSALGSRTTLYEIFNTIEIQNAKMVGQLVLTQIGDRKFSLDCTGSTADQDLIIGDKLILKKGTMEYLRAYNIGATLNFGSVPANSSVERPIPIGVSLANSRVNVTATPSTPLPDGLLYNYFVKPDDLSNVTVRVRNVTGSAINAGGDIIWQALVYLR
ncbi:hypothetical protein ACY3WP_001572 [Acinetobacter baumannii]|uniref:hypothetical protein n=1 Tax=Acinetobacter baumannii TaxID=470 RepID=UPI001ED78611|nr:hypothetical protein [Acinetobacter baumannii]EKT8680268.1 hypothetical protein [Acinetobacter baumannii]EKU0562243.1 hypothetical protein [Acinetobacter baumannii]EKU2508754.1 hypothetical protein [Acinetobacter baumannii]EKW2952608.1 hypothetical protein [Acinetobacter baumannii]EKW7200655.1 hypothetical protein [Acinetobacter baumannii]